MNVCAFLSPNQDIGLNRLKPPLSNPGGALVNPSLLACANLVMVSIGLFLVAALSNGTMNPSLLPLLVNNPSPP
jgi:hypothetical protein